MTDKREFYSVMEFADKLGIHPNTVRTAIKKGRIQAFRVGLGVRSDYRIPSTEVERICELDMSKLLKVMVDDAVGKAMEKKNGSNIKMDFG